MGQTTTGGAQELPGRAVGNRSWRRQSPVLDLDTCFGYKTIQ